MFSSDVGMLKSNLFDIALSVVRLNAGFGTTSQTTPLFLSRVEAEIELLTSSFKGFEVCRFSGLFLTISTLGFCCRCKRE